jgi:hypothetical protein
MKLKGLVCLTLLLAVDVRAAIDSHPSVPEGVGVNIHFIDPAPGEMKMLAESGVHWIRMDFAWNGTETTKGQYNFAAYDQLVAALEQHKIRAIFILDYTNKLYDNDLSPYTDEGVNAFARWAAAAASHFRGRGILWEMYNEPNSGFWRPKQNAQAYIKLALAVGEAIHQVAPGEDYIGPAAAGVDLRFLEACFKAGLLNYWSAVSVHAYRAVDPETASADFQALRILMRRYAPKGKHVPILSGEWGYSSCSFGLWKEVDEEKQGKLLARQWLSNLANDVPVSVWYDWHDDGLDPKEQDHHFGIVHYRYDGTHDPVYSPKPAYRAAKTLTTQLDGYHFNKRLSVGGSNDYALMFSRGDAVSVVVWTTAPAPHPVVIPASPGGFLVTAHTGEKLPSLTAGNDGLNVLATDAPQYLEAEKPDPLWRVAAAWDRAALEIFANTPRTALTLHLRNPLTAPIRVRVNGEAQPEAPPGRELTITTGLNVMRQTEPARVVIECEVAGLGRIAQETQVIPFLVTLYPFADNALPVGISNPSGESFRGSVALTELQGLRCGTCRVPLEFKAGETDTTLRVPLDSTPPLYEVGAKVQDDKGETVLNVSAQRFAAVDNFLRYASGSPPPAYQLVPDGDPKVASQQTLTVAAPPEGPPFQGMGCLKIAYHFAAGWKFIHWVPAATAIQGQPHSFGLWLYPEGEPNIVQLRIVDQTGQMFQEGYLPLSWKGWHYNVLPMGATPAHWGGANDGVVHYPIHWDCLLLIDNPGRKETQGALYVSGPTLIY